MRANGVIVTTSTELVAQANALLTGLRFPEAGQYLRKAMIVDPGSVPALLGLARVALVGRRLDEAMEWLDRALSLQPGCAEVLALKGLYWMQQQQFETAIILLEQARAMDPDLAMTYFNLGKCYCELRQFGPAETNLRKAIELNPRHFDAYGQLGHVKIETGRPKDAVNSMRRAIEVNPRYLHGYLVLASLCERAGRFQNAVRVLRAGIRRNPGGFPLRERLCALYASAGDFASAFQEALEITKRRNLYTDYLRLGSYAIALQNFATAQEAFETSLQLNPTSWEGHYNLAEIYMSARLMDQAREQYQAALGKNSGAYKPLNGMGLFVLIVDQDCERAISLLQQATELAPSRPEPLLNLALAYAKKGDFAASQRYAASVLPLAIPSDPIYQQAERLQGAVRIESRTLRSLK
jgi:tetratricopeptide (TPR) repeat protein